MTDITAPTRTVDGAEMPRAGRWTVDPGHAEVGFVGRHLVFTKVRGRFVGVEGTVQLGEDVSRTTVVVTVDMTTVDSGDDTRDNHLRSPDFFDVERHPVATFHSEEVTWSGSAGSMSGTLTIKDVARPVTLAVEYRGYAQDPWGNDRAVFSAHGRIDREDWGLTWNMPLAQGGLLVSREIDLVLEVELVLQR